jgi:Ca-activated chloride channel family protein
LFVTDGEPTIGERNPDVIASRVSKLRGDTRIFSFGVGADLNAALVERLAVEGKGTAQFVRPDESVERAVSIVASRLANPLVTDVRVYADGVRLTKQLPSASSDIFAGQDFVLLSRYSGSGPTQLRFEGRTSRGPVTWTSRVAFPSSTRENSFVARLWATQRIGYLSAEKRKNGESHEIDNEIRDLGERYAIPTEFTSYLVVEPGMMRNQADFSGRGVRGGTANGVALQGQVSGVAPAPSKGFPTVPLSQVVVTGAAAFEKARDASAQRAATNLAAADAIDDAKIVEARRAGSKIFQKKGDTWIDAAKSDSARTVRIKPYSDAYFKLIDAVPDLRDVFSLGDKVTVGTKTITIELADDGLMSISDFDLKTIQSSW